MKVNKTITIGDIDYEVSYTVVVDNDYGADADGRRGTRVVYMEDFKILNWRDVEDAVQAVAIDSMSEDGGGDGTSSDGD